MKILQVIDGLGTGGAEKLMVDIVPLLANAENQVDVVLLDDTVTPFFQELEKSGTCNIITLGKGFYNPLYIWKLSRLLRGYDLVHVHLFPAQYFAAFAKIISRSKAKFIFTEHNTTNRRIENPKFRRIENFIYSCYDKIICITPEVKDSLLRHLLQQSANFEVITNGIDTQKFANAEATSRASFSLSFADKLLVMVAGFREQKDHDTIISALEYLPKHYKLLLVGDGKRRKILEELTEKLQLTEQVIFLGVRSDVAQIYKMCDVAILSSHWEGFGLAAVEAMAAGVPLIASRVAGLSQVVGEGGLLFTQGDSKDFTEKVIYLENEAYKKELIEKGLSRASQFDIHFMVERLKKLYKSLVNGDEK